MTCPKASGCTLRQCVERATATSPAGRAGCRNLALLDAGAPSRDMAALPARARAVPPPVPAGAAAPMRHDEPAALPR
jgi:hypothetical protein